MNPSLPRQILFWTFIAVAGLCEAAFAYNDFNGGILRWGLIGLTVINICLFAYLDRTPPVRKAIVYVAAALVWGGIRYGYRWVHEGLGDHDLTLATLLLWVDMTLNFVTAFILLGAVRQAPDLQSPDQ